MDTENFELIYLTVDMWHPDCWALKATDDTKAELLGYDMTMDQGHVRLYRAHVSSHDELDTLLDAIDQSELTDDVIMLSRSSASFMGGQGRVMRDILVDCNPEPGLRGAFAAHGFMHYGPSHHRDGRERRSLLTLSNRLSVDQTLADIKAAYDADFDIQRITTTPPRNSSRLPFSELSPRQREAFQLARARGYYEYPRGVTAEALADELDITKTTFLEHLRKAERSLLTEFEIN